MLPERQIAGYMLSIKSRSAGVLVHPSSLPGRQAYGALGQDTLNFLDFLHAAGFSLWQILPLGPVDQTGSPYNSASAFAGDARLVCQEEMRHLGLTPPTPLFPDPYWHNMPLFSAFDHYRNVVDHPFQQRVNQFCAEQAHWLYDYALFCAIKNSEEGRAWSEWPTPLRDREPAALEEFSHQHQMLVDYFLFEQCVFFAQWQQVRQHAQQRHIHIIGDIPIFVAWDSADVWAHREFFLLDETGLPKWVAGVPPDYFSPEGQHWGNPLYNWPQLSATGYAWWLARIEHALTLFDLLRIDHFRGFCACWEIPATATTAREGRWVEVPGRELFEALRSRLPHLSIIAEDLGIITEDVIALRDDFALPGMTILQFAFDGSTHNPYLPHNHERNTVVYTGTHDNNTTLGWYGELTSEEQLRVNNYLGFSSEPMPRPMVRAALASVARTAVIPLQDLLEMGTDARMNTPGTETGNWQWRCQWSDFGSDLAERCRNLLASYGRLTG